MYFVSVETEGGWQFFTQHNGSLSKFWLVAAITNIDGKAYGTAEMPSTLGQTPKVVLSDIAKNQKGYAMTL